MLSSRVPGNFLTDNAFQGITAVGMTCVILSGGIDRPVGAVIGFTGVFVAVLITWFGVYPLVAFVLALLVSALFGAAMAAAIGYLAVPGFMVTLEAKGPVEARAKVGTRVPPCSRWNLFDRQVLFWIFHSKPEAGFLESLTELRRTLETQAATLAAKRRTAEQIRMMRYWLQQHEISAQMAESCGLASYEIHRLVFEASRNPLLRSATGLLEYALAIALRNRIFTRRCRVRSTKGHPLCQADPRLRRRQHWRSVAGDGPDPED